MTAKTTRSLDHFVISVGDIEIASEMYRRLGFRVMPTMEHMHIGTSNSIVQFHDTYLELIGEFELANSELLSKGMEPWTSQGDVFWQTSFTSSRLDDEIERWAAAGLKMEAITSAARRVRLPNRGYINTASRSSYIWNPQDKLASLFISDHPVPEAIWIPEYQCHPNSCIRVAGFRYLMADPAKHVDYFSKVTGGEPAKRSNEGVRFETPRGEFVELLTPSALHARYPEAPQLSPGTETRGAVFTIVVESLERCRWALRDGGVPHRITDGAIVTGAAYGCGVAYEFVEGK
ncbi:VOC family protein [Novosphingobium sp. Gsoil 351]|uniref:VOC family protein n=1 Tax=Novosphingobium sp. Gsoil 351 TaxID=2675225 RepID=UPI0018A85D97|nr:VOC family protein [Novosphingobium sp. Gsoil 351]